MSPDDEVQVMNKSHNLMLFIYDCIVTYYSMHAMSFHIKFSMRGIVMGLDLLAM